MLEICLSQPGPRCFWNCFKSSSFYFYLYFIKSHAGSFFFSFCCPTLSESFGAKQKREKEKYNIQSQPSKDCLARRLIKNKLKVASFCTSTCRSPCRLGVLGFILSPEGKSWTGPILRLCGPPLRCGRLTKLCLLGPLSPENPRKGAGQE